MACTRSCNLPHDAAEDSFDFLPVLRGEQGDEPVRPYLLQHATRQALAIRKGRWRYLDHRGSGGNDYGRGRLQPLALPDTAPEAPGQLNDLEADPGETTNLYFEQPEIVRELREQLERWRDGGRSRPAGTR